MYEPEDFLAMDDGGIYDTRSRYIKINPGSCKIVDLTPSERVRAK